MNESGASSRVGKRRVKVTRGGVCDSTREHTKGLQAAILGPHEQQNQVILSYKPSVKRVMLTEING